MRNVLKAAARCALFVWLCCAAAGARPVHNYVFFGLGREKIREAASFLSTDALEGAQVTYTWRQLEPERDAYDFGAVREDLAFLTSKGKRLFIQLQDLSFLASRVNVPRYLLDDPAYNGGADKEYEVGGDGDEEHAPVVGWAARRWDPAVRERFRRLLSALGREFDGRVEGVNLTETSVGFGESGCLFPKGFSFEAYRDGVIANMRALRRAFPKSAVIQYANFMPGEWLPEKDRGYLRAVYRAARELEVGVGGPDLLPNRRGQRKHSYPLIREASGAVTTGVAVQDGNYADPDPRTGRPLGVAELLKFATEYLKVDYVFWCTEEPYYSEQLIPFFKRGERR